MGQQRTEISDVGEFGLIDRIRRIVDIRIDDASAHDNLLRGIGDDAGVFKASAGKVQLITTDALVEGIHFDLTYASLKHLGWKSIVASMSDVAAMGGVPRYATVTIALPQKISVEMVEELYQGVSYACKKYACLIIGGDTTASHANLMISVTMIGEAEEKRILHRTGAQVGDYLCVTGHLGGSLAGLKVLLREKERFMKAQSTATFEPNLEPYAPAIEKHLMPKPRLDIAKILSTEVRAHAMIDVSDGLASEVNHLCTASGVGAELHEHNLPVDGTTQNIAEELGDHVSDYLLYGGEEYELLFTISEAEYEKLEKLTDDVTIIGRMREKDHGVKLVREQGEIEALTPIGWNHFRR